MKKLNKVGIAALICALLDILAALVIGYIAMNTMNLIAWVLLMIFGLLFAFDAARAIRFIIELLKR